VSDNFQAVISHAQEILGEDLLASHVALGELTFDVKRESILRASRILRDDQRFAFEQLIDLCGIDYLNYGQDETTGANAAALAHRPAAGQGRRFAAVYHLLSVKHNRRLRLRAWLEDDFPRIESVVDLLPAANWFEREAFDLFGIVFEGHPDLRRLLTDYGFVGHPFRKDFPISGHVEMRYDPEKQRVVYQPVSIEPRVLVPRTIRDEGFARG
jgi:NADH-quinone oxidoreductase subunit C